MVWLSICEEVIGLSIDRNYFKDRTEWDGTYPYPPEFKHMEDLSGLEAAPGVLLKPPGEPRRGKSTLCGGR